MLDLINMADNKFFLQDTLFLAARETPLRHIKHAGNGKERISRNTTIHFVAVVTRNDLEFF